MQAAAHGHSTLGIPEKVGKEFARADARDEAVLAPSAAIPAGLRRRQAFDSSAATAHFAGILHVAPDGDILLLRRTGTPGQDSYVGHWSLPGGGCEDGETPQQGAVRENKEEMGLDVDPAGLKAFDETITPTGKAFHTYAAAAPKKFWPALNDEHNGAGWFPLSELPRPMHPAVEKSLTEKLGLATDMAPEGWQGLRDGLLQWLAEEEREPEHAADIAMDRAMTRATAVMATDSPLQIAMDRDSVRQKTREGRLIVKRTHISKANVCPYRGKEIPGWEALGLDPAKIYNLLRDPEELRKAAPTLNGVQLLIKHTPVKSTDPHQDKTVGSLGTDAEFDGEYLDNSLFVNTQDAIDGIESGRQAELSAGYHYVPDMTPGNFHGTAYDGVMRSIVFNHVALVEDGRAGPDVVVADSMENIMAKPTRFAALVLGATAAHLSPLIAMDSAVTLPSGAFAELTSKNFKAKKAALLTTVRAALTGKLRPGMALDASMAGLAKAIDAFEELDKGVDEEVAKPEEMESAAKVGPLDIKEPAATTPSSTPAFDAEPMKSFLREKGMGEDDIEKVCGLAMPKTATDEDPVEKEKKEKAAAAAAADKAAKDSAMVDKPAMDAALKAQADHFQKELAKVRDNERGVRAAIAEVHPWTGDLPPTMAFDTAADVFRHALIMKGVEGAKDLHPDALQPILRTLPKPGARTTEQHREQPIAMDASIFDKAKTYAPGLEHISLAD